MRVVLGRRGAKVYCLLLPLAFAGCGPAFIRTNVEVFHDLPPDYAGQRIAIVPADPTKAGTIEFRTYAEKLGERLAVTGFEVVPPNQEPPPDYIAALAYGVGAPQAGPAVTSGSVTPNYAGGARYAGVTTVATAHPRALVIGIYAIPQQEGEEMRQIYMVTATSTGRCRALSAVIDPMLDAAFEEFPGESGRSRTVTDFVAGLSC